LQGYGGNGDSPSFGPMLLRSLSVFAAGETVPANLRAIFALLGGALLAVAAARLLAGGPPSRRALGLLAAYLLTPLLATWASALQRPVFNERYLSAALPPFCLLVATAVCPPARAYHPDSPPLSKRMPGHLSFVLPAIALAALVLVGICPALSRYYGQGSYSKTLGWRELAGSLDTLAAHMPDGKVRIAQNFPDPTLWYYYAGPLQHVVLPPAAHDRESSAKEVANMVKSGIDWVIIPLQPAPGWDDNSIAQMTLAQQFSLVTETQAGAWPVQVYARHPEPMAALNVQYRGGPTLAEAAIQPKTAEPGSVVIVHLVWCQLPGSLTGSEKVSHQLLDAGGKLAAQVDRPLDAGGNATSVASYGLIMPNGLSSGDYRIIAVLYDPAQPGAPRRVTVEGSDAVNLGTVTME